MIVTLLFHPRLRIPVANGKWAPELNARHENAVSAEQHYPPGDSPQVGDEVNQLSRYGLDGYAPGIVRKRIWNGASLSILVDTWELPSKDKP